jgi:hypothetical protein
LSERIAAKVKNTKASGEAISAAELEFGTTAVEDDGPEELVLLAPVVEALVAEPVVEEPAVVVLLVPATPVVVGAAVLELEVLVADTITEESDDWTEERTDDTDDEADEAAELTDERTELEEADAVGAAPPMSSN